MMPKVGVDIKFAAEVLRRGDVVAFPTETVYGLGACAANDQALAKIFELKGRPKTHPLIVHILDFSEAEQWAAQFPPAARALARRFSPGAITLLLPRADTASPLLCGGGDYIALRTPAHPIARRLLRLVGGGIAAPSANRFGRISPTAAAHTAAEFADCADLYILDGGDCDIGLESTIVGFQNDTPFIVRPGFITADDIAQATGKTLIAAPPAIRAPGTLARHYAPTTPLHITPPDKINNISAVGAGVISSTKPAAVAAALWRHAAANPTTYAKNLYRHLRELDESPATVIHIQQPPTTPAWHAINDRLTRAATPV